MLEEIIGSIATTMRRRDDDISAQAAISQITERLDSDWWTRSIVRTQPNRWPQKRATNG